MLMAVGWRRQASKALAALIREASSATGSKLPRVTIRKKLKSPIKKLMIEWVFDDKNKNILYKNDGSERYPDFKLYKMIARNVHKHTPQNVLKKPLFEN